MVACRASTARELQLAKQFIHLGSVTWVSAPVSENDRTAAIENEVTPKLQHVFPRLGSPETPAVEYLPEIVDQDMRLEEHPPAATLQPKGPVDRPLGVAQKWERPRLHPKVGREYCRFTLGDRDQLRPQGMNLTKAVLHLAQVRPARDSGQVAEKNEEYRPNVQLPEWNRRAVGPAQGQDFQIASATRHCIPCRT